MLSKDTGQGRETWQTKSATDRGPATQAGTTTFSVRGLAAQAGTTTFSARGGTAGVPDGAGTAATARGGVGRIASRHMGSAGGGGNGGSVSAAAAQITARSPQLAVAETCSSGATGAARERHTRSRASARMGSGSGERRLAVVSMAAMRSTSVAMGASCSGETGEDGEAWREKSLDQAPALFCETRHSCLSHGSKMCRPEIKKKLERTREIERARAREYFGAARNLAAFLSFFLFIHQEYTHMSRQRTPLLTTSIPMIRASRWTI